MIFWKGADTVWHTPYIYYNYPDVGDSMLSPGGGGSFDTTANYHTTGAWVMDSLWLGAKNADSIAITMQRVKTIIEDSLDNYLSSTTHYASSPAAAGKADSATLAHNSDSLNHIAASGYLLSGAQDSAAYLWADSFATKAGVWRFGGGSIAGRSGNDTIYMDTTSAYWAFNGTRLMALTGTSAVWKLPGGRPASDSGFYFYSADTSAMAIGATSKAGLTVKVDTTTASPANSKWVGIRVKGTAFNDASDHAFEVVDKTGTVRLWIDGAGNLNNVIGGSYSSISTQNIGCNGYGSGLWWYAYPTYYLGNAIRQSLSENFTICWGNSYKGDAIIKDGNSVAGGTANDVFQIQDSSGTIQIYGTNKGFLSAKSEALADSLRLGGLLTPTQIDWQTGVTGGTVLADSGNMPGLYAGWLTVAKRLIASSDSVAGKVYFNGATRVAKYLPGVDANDVVNATQENRAEGTMQLIGAYCKADSIIFTAGAALTDSLNYVLWRRP